MKSQLSRENVEGIKFLSAFEISGYVDVLLNICKMRLLDFPSSSIQRYRRVPVFKSLVVSGRQCTDRVKPSRALDASSRVFSQKTM